jgi:hypothetical protein
MYTVIILEPEYLLRISQGTGLMLNAASNPTKNCLAAKAVQELEIGLNRHWYFTPSRTKIYPG